MTSTPEIEKKKEARNEALKKSLEAMEKLKAKAMKNLFPEGFVQEGKKKKGALKKKKEAEEDEKKEGVKRKKQVMEKRRNNQSRRE